MLRDSLAVESQIRRNNFALDVDKVNEENGAEIDLMKPFERTGPISNPRILLFTVGKRRVYSPSPGREGGSHGYKIQSRQRAEKG
jgi:hypothetical protein